MLLEVLRQAAPQGSGTKATPPSGHASSLSLTGGTDWGMLREAVTVLQQYNSAAVRQAVDFLPAANERLAANMVVFVAAVRAVDSRLWPGGNGLEALRRAPEHAGPQGTTR